MRFFPKTGRRDNEKNGRKREGGKKKGEKGKEGAKTEKSNKIATNLEFSVDLNPRETEATFKRGETNVQI